MSEKKSLGADAAAVESAGSIVSDAATARHTEGPWRVDSTDPCLVVTDSRGYALIVADTNAFSELSDSQAQRNAHLIAAAPELIGIVRILDGDVRRGEPCPICGCSPHDRHCALVAAIAKAEGR